MARFISILFARHHRPASLVHLRETEVGGGLFLCVLSLSFPILGCVQFKKKNTSNISHFHLFFLFVHLLCLFFINFFRYIPPKRYYLC